MEKAGENSASSSNVELYLGLSLNGGSQRSVASNATEVETQQPPVPEIYPKGMMMRSVLMSTPRVFTRGEGPNGKKTDGFLYSYKKKEDIKIVCVCHGYVLTPAEFVKHAGGGDVENPLRQIIINPMPK